jgi:hypothetical protein
MKSRSAADGAGAPSALLASSDPARFPAEPEDQDTGDVPTGVDEDALNEDDLDTDQVTSPDSDVS